MKSHFKVRFFLAAYWLAEGFHSQGLQAQSCLVQEIKNPIAFPRGLADIVERYKARSLTSAADNQRFIELSKDGAQKDTVFLHWDFKLLKILNDKVFITPETYGKAGVDAVVHLGQELLISRLKESEIFKDKIIGQYVDYKSVRVVVYEQNLSPKSMQQLRDIALEASRDFASVLENVFGENSSVAVALRNKGVGDFQKWHSFELAEKSADMASTLARVSSQRAELGIKDGEAISQDRVGRIISELETNNRQVIVSDLSGSPLLEKGPSGEFLPSKKLLDIMRKGPADSSSFVSYLQAMVEARFDVQISKKTCLNLLEYFQKIDLFSPSVLVSEPVIIDLTNAVHGAVSVDFAGQNVFNLFYTADALASTARLKLTGRELAMATVQKSRLNDLEYSTPRLRSLRDNINGIAKYYNLGVVKFTGDDGMIVLQREMNNDLFKNVLADLGKFSLTGEVGDYRIVYMHPIIKKGKLDSEAMRLKISSEGESAEKEFRNWHSNYFAKDSADPLGIAVKLYPDASRMEFIFLGERSENASKRMSREIQDGFAQKYGYSSAFSSSQ